MVIRSILATSLMLTGCTMGRSLASRATLILEPGIQAGSYFTKTTLTAYTQASINHLILKLYTYDGSEHDQGIQKAIPNAQLGNPITFANLKANTTYRIKAYAYFTSDESQLISTSDVNSYTDVTLINDDRPTIASLKVKLIDQAFNGQATASGVVVTSGGYLSAGAELANWMTPVGISTTLAGSTTSGYADGVGTAAKFNCPIGVALDASGSVYVVERYNNLVRKITPDGVVSTLAGGGGGTASGYEDGTGTTAKFNNPFDLAVDSAGNVYVADAQNNMIRKITSNGVVTTFAGGGAGLNAGYLDATGTNAKFAFPDGIALDAQHNLYVSDNSNQRIRKISAAGVVTTLAGNGATAFADGTGTAATFHYPGGLAVDSQGYVYVADSWNPRIRKISPSGVVVTVAGSGNNGFANGTGNSASFSFPYCVRVDALGNLFVADTGNHRIRKISTGGVVTTLGGNGSTVFANGIGTSATYSSPGGVAVDSLGHVYVADSGFNQVRLIQ